MEIGRIDVSWIYFKGNTRRFSDSLDVGYGINEEKTRMRAKFLIFFLSQLLNFDLGPKISYFRLLY